MKFFVITGLCCAWKTSGIVFPNPTCYSWCHTQPHQRQQHQRQKHPCRIIERSLWTNQVPKWHVWKGFVSKHFHPPSQGNGWWWCEVRSLDHLFCLENVIRFCWTWHCYWELGWVLQFNQPCSALATYGTWLLDAGWPKFSMRKSWFIATFPTSDAHQMPISSGVVCENDPSILHTSPSTKKKRYIYNVVYRASCLSYLLSFFEWSSAKSALDQG